MHIEFGDGATVRATRLAILIPDRDRHGRPVADAERWADEARRLFTRLFGGCLCLAGRGMWQARTDGIIIEERCTIVMAYVRVADIRANRGALDTFIEAFRVGADQEAVAVELGGALHLIAAPAARAVA